MAGSAKSTAKIIAVVKESPQAQSKASRAKELAVTSKALTARKIMRKAGVMKSKSSPKSAGAEKKASKKEKSKKIKMVRDSFTMPEDDYAKIFELKKKCLKAGVHIKKSELLRAGLSYLSKLSNPALLKTVKQVEKIKTGRPAKHR